MGETRSISVASPLIIGVGNPWRADDGAGIVLARRMRARPHAPRVVTALDVLELLDRWEDAERVVVVDAIRSGRPPGTIVRIDGSTGLRPSGFPTSTHGVNLVQAVALGEALDRLPARLTVFGIEGKDFGHGVRLSEAVERGLDELERRVLEEIATEAEEED